MIKYNYLIRRRILIFTSLCSAIIVLGLTYDFYSHLSDREQQCYDQGTETVNFIGTKLDSLLQEVMNETHALASHLEENQYSEEELLNIIEQESKANESILGITVAFEPYAFDKSIRLYAPYFDKRHDEFLFIEKSYDYTDSKLTTAKWYTKVVEQKKAIWSEPYLAGAAQVVVTDYGIPLFHTLNGEKKLIGTLTYTLTLDNLSKFIDNAAIGSTGYAYMVSPNKNIISHINYEYVLNTKIDELAQIENFQEQEGEIWESSDGFYKYLNESLQTEFYNFYETIDQTGWKIILVFATEDLLGPPLLLGNKVVNLAISFSIFLLVSLAVFIRINQDTHSKLWLISTILSFLLAINIGLIWWLNININYAYDDEEHERVRNFAALQQFIYQENAELDRLGYDLYIPIKTGLYIDNIEFNDSYSISIRGKLWQLWPIDHAHEPDFVFLQQSSKGRLSKSLISKKLTPAGDEYLYSWDFTTRITMPLKYHNYPFDSRDINIEISYPDLQTGVMLVPDMEGYPILDPSTFPGINPKIYFPKSEMVSTFFSFEPVVYKTTFGNRARGGDDQYKVMAYNIYLKRRFINAFVVNIIPIMVVATMIFLIFYSNSKKKDSETGISMMGVVQSCAGFFFVLLLAHINLRKELSTPEISYMETFYFSMYVMIALLAINIVAFTKFKNSLILHYEDNLLIKLIYWPLLLGAWLVITLHHFYR